MDGLNTAGFPALDVNLILFNKLFVGSAVFEVNKITWRYGTPVLTRNIVSPFVAADNAA